MITCDVAIVGAGPYGLSAAAHLKAANGLDIRVFGEPMSFWERHMPKFMLLRSPLAASHSCDHRDLSSFFEKKVVVIGGGQSALESAALLHEAGADVEVLVRAPFVRWLWRQKWFHTFKPVARMLYAPADVGQAGLSHLVARPNLFRRLPRSLQDKWGKTLIIRLRSVVSNEAGYHINIMTCP